MMEANMKFEELARKAFDDCSKYGDPFKYAAQERYDNFVPIPTLLGKRILSTILIKIIISLQEKTGVDKLIELENEVWTSETQAEIISIIEKADTLFDKLKD